MKRSEAIPYVAYVVDDAGSGRSLGDDQHAIVRDHTRQMDPQHGGGHEYASILIGWHIGFKLIFVAVHSYLDVRLDNDKATELATDYLAELELFVCKPYNKPDYIIR